MHYPKKYSFQLLNTRSVRNKVNLITQLIIESNCSISAITEIWLTIYDSALASQLTPDGFKVFLANKYTPHRRSSRHFPTNNNGNTIDLVLSLADSNFISYPTQIL